MSRADGFLRYRNNKISLSPSHNMLMYKPCKMGFGISEVECPLYIQLECSECEQKTEMIKYTPKIECFRQKKHDIDSEIDGQIKSSDLNIHQLPSDSLEDIMVEYCFTVEPPSSLIHDSTEKKRTSVVNYSIYDEDEPVLKHSESCKLA